MKGIFNISELLMLVREKYFRDQEVLDQCFKNLPKYKRLEHITIHCSSSKEMSLIEAVAPENVVINSYLFPEDLEGNPNDIEVQIKRFKRYQHFFINTKDYLLNYFKGKYVAIGEGGLLDADINERNLQKRIYEKYGKIQIFIEKVEEGRFQEKKVILDDWDYQVV